MPDSPRIALAPVDVVEITMLVDNDIDQLLPPTERAKRHPMSGLPSGPRVETPLLDDPSIAQSLVAEHGLSALVRVTAAGRARTLLFDAGLSPGGLAHNMDVLETPLADAEAIVMSHGHIDHIGGLHGLVSRFGRARMPMLLHPQFWRRRRIVRANASPVGIPPPSRAAIAGAGFELVEEREPSLLLDGSVLVTGEVARTTEFEHGFPGHEAQRDGAWEPDPLILDDQALVANVRGLGLVVLSGCGHAGIINIIRHAQALTGESRVAAVIGGFHLTVPLFAHAIRPTVDALAAFAPAMLVPAHCTGFPAQRALAEAMPDAFLQSTVGARFSIAAAG